MPYPAAVNWSNRHYVVEGRNRRLKVEVVCPDCGRARFVDRRNIDGSLKQGSFTGRCHECHSRLRGESAPAWRGGRHLGSSGRYVYLTVPPNHPFACMANCRNEIAEHRLVMAEKLGRPLRQHEHVHHIDGDRTNNDPRNLMVLAGREHLRIEKLIELGRMPREGARGYADALGA